MNKTAILRDKRNAPVPREIQKSSRKGQGALLFWTWFNTIGGRQDRTDQTILSLSRAVQIQRQRLDVQEKIIVGLSEIIRQKEPLVHFACISCGKRFDVREGEARTLDMLEICPVCRGWAFPDSAGRIYTTKMIAAELNVSNKWVVQHGKEKGLGRTWGGGNGTGSYLYFTEQEFQQLRDLPKGRPGRRAR